MSLVEPGFPNGLSINVGSVATSVVFDPPAIFVGEDASVLARALRVVEDNSALPVTTEEIVLFRNKLKSGPGIGTRIHH